LRWPLSGCMGASNRGWIPRSTYDVASRVTGLAYCKDTTTLGTLSYT